MEMGLKIAGLDPRSGLKQANFLWENALSQLDENAGNLINDGVDDVSDTKH